jgi:four helix bundle protein
MKYLSFQEIPVWKSGHELTLLIYKLVKSFPSSEKFILIPQIIRATISIPANISEGFHRHSTKELLNFLYIARGSCGEVYYYLILSKSLNYLNQEDFDRASNLSISISKQLSAWVNSLKK